MSLSLRNLRYFCAAYEERSTVGAARVCHVTQPAISAAVAQLEEELGVRLFLRQQRGLSPTPAAQRLYRMAGKLLADSQAIAASFRDGADNPRLALRILPALSLQATRRLLRHWREQMPRLELRIVSAEEPADVELTASSCAAEGMRFVPLWEERYVLAVPDDHPLAVQDHVGLADLHRVAFVERTHCEMHAAWQQAMGRGEVVPDVRARADNEEWALGLVSAGVGVTIAPLHAATRCEGVVLRHDVAELEPYRRSVGLAFHPPATPVLESLLSGVADVGF